MTPDEGAAVIDAPGAPSVPEILVRVEHVAKAFGATQALRDCSFELRAGEVHALAGENGSGKSTLVKILSGVHVPDSGRVEVAGAEVQLRSPKSRPGARHRHRLPGGPGRRDCSVLDNVWLGADATWRTRIPAREKRRLAKAALEELFDRPIDLSTAMEDLSLSDRQACCIVRALLRRPRILILDEATSALDVATRDRLFALIARLAADGVGVIFITHRMDEIDEIGDRITVMRSGETVASLSRGAWTPRQLVGLMTGAEELVTIGRPEKRQAASRSGAPVLSVRGLRLRPDGQPIDLEVHAGELIGLAGLEGHGQNEFLEALWGENVIAGEVVRHLPGRDVVVRSPVHAANCDIAYVPRERGLDSLFSWMTIRENFALPTLSRQPLRLAQPALVAAAPRHLHRPAEDRPGLPRGRDHDAVRRQPAAGHHRPLARLRAADPAAQRPHPRHRHQRQARPLRPVRRAGREQLAIVMLSTELDEHVELMDRVLVFREHELFRELDRGELSREALVAAFFGESGED